MPPEDTEMPDNTPQRAPRDRDPLAAPASMAPTSIGAAQDLAEELAKSDLVPASLQGNSSSVLLIIMDAITRGRNVMTHLRSRYVVRGNLGISAAALIAEMNASGAFKGLVKFTWKNEGQGDLECTCSAVDANTEDEVSVTFKLSTAINAGWTTDKYGKTKENWANLPEQMCAYRAATFFARLYCPQAAIGCAIGDEMDQVAARGATKDAERAREIEESITTIPVEQETAPPNGERKLFTSDDPSIDYD